MIIAVIAGLGQRALLSHHLLRRNARDYVRTARQRHARVDRALCPCLEKRLIPILTGVVVTLPFLFAGSLLLESFFAIPGMGSFMLEAIQRQDFAVGRPWSPGVVSVRRRPAAHRHQLYPSRPTSAFGVKVMHGLGIQPVLLWSDLLIYTLLCVGGLWFALALRREYWRVAQVNRLQSRGDAEFYHSLPLRGCGLPGHPAFPRHRIFQSERGTYSERPRPHLYLSLYRAVRRPILLPSRYTSIPRRRC